MTVSEISFKFHKNKRWLYRHLPKLTEAGLLLTGKKNDEKANKDVITYRCSFDLTPSSIPTWGEICDYVDSLIPELVEKNEKSEHEKSEHDKIFSIPKKGVKTDKTDKTPSLFLPSKYGEKLLKRWLCQGFARLSQPPSCCKIALVVTGVSIPFSRRVLTVFPVLTYFLRERDKEKYSRYLDYKEKSPKNKIIKQKEFNSHEQKPPSLDVTKHDTISGSTSKIDVATSKISGSLSSELTSELMGDVCLNDKIRELKEFISREQKALRKVWYDSLVSCFSESFISRCIEAGLLIKLPDGSFE
jgi:hypothetical protein